MTNIFAAVIGLVAGLLINYLADILPVRRKLAAPVCLNCGQYQAFMNYFFWPRKCPHCGFSRPVRIWIVDISAVVIAVWFWNSTEAQQQLGILMGAVSLVYFAVIVVIDYEYKLILHPTSMVGVIIGLAVGVSLNGWGNTLIGGAVGYGLMFLLYYFGILFTKLMARIQGRQIDEVALGFGDVNLNGVLGLMLGWPNIVIMLFLSVISAGIAGALLMLGKLVNRKYKSFMVAMPYGPFLILGAFLLLFLPSFTQNILNNISPLF
jgi:leader peptidase (prepilin peptidase) / N-methyltransferase